MRVVINPGAGAVGRDADSLGHAYDNMRRLLADAGIPDASYRRDPDAQEGDGRFTFLVTLGDPARDVSVAMPGLPLERVRFAGRQDQDPWDFPRLYVDGSSWLWLWAVDALHERAFGDDEVQS